MSVVLDDGRYFEVADDADQKGVYLFARNRGQKKADVCVGHALVQTDQSWEVRVTVPYDGDSNSDSVLVGHCDSRMDAIVMLWQNRFDATLPLGW